MEVRKISTKLKGNKVHTLESWRFQKGSGKNAKVVTVKERPSYLVTVSSKNNKGKLISTTKELHSKRAVDGVLSRCGINKPSYPVESLRHKEDITFKKQGLKMFISSANLRKLH